MDVYPLKYGITGFDPSLDSSATNYGRKIENEAAKNWIYMTWKHQDFYRTIEEFTSKHGALICFNYNQQKLIFNQGKRMNCTALASLYITSSDLEYLAATAGSSSQKQSWINIYGNQNHEFQGGLVKYETVLVDRFGWESTKFLKDPNIGRFVKPMGTKSYEQINQWKRMTKSLWHCSARKVNRDWIQN